MFKLNWCWGVWGLFQVCVGERKEGREGCKSQDQTWDSRPASQPELYRVEAVTCVSGPPGRLGVVSGGVTAWVWWGSWLWKQTLITCFHVSLQWRWDKGQDIAEEPFPCLCLPAWVRPSGVWAGLVGVVLGRQASECFSLTYSSNLATRAELGGQSNCQSEWPEITAPLDPFSLCCGWWPGKAYPPLPSIVWLLTEACSYCGLSLYSHWTNTLAREGWERSDHKWWFWHCGVLLKGAKHLVMWVMLLWVCVTLWFWGVCDDELLLRYALFATLGQLW